MAYDLIPRRFFNIPSIWSDEDEDLVFSGNSGLTVSEDLENVYVEAAMPGIDPDKVEITFDKGMLWIRGAMEETEEDKKKKFYRKASSSYSYRITVPGEIDLNKEPEAEAKNGVMIIKFPKSPETKPKKISIKAK